MQCTTTDAKLSGKKETHSLMTLEVLIIGQQVWNWDSLGHFISGYILWQTKRMQDKTNVISVIIIPQALLIMHLRKFHRE